MVFNWTRRSPEGGESTIFVMFYFFLNHLQPLASLYISRQPRCKMASRVDRLAHKIHFLPFTAILLFLYSTIYCVFRRTCAHRILGFRLVYRILIFLWRIQQHMISLSGVVHIYDTTYYGVRVGKLEWNVDGEMEWDGLGNACHLLIVRFLVMMKPMTWWRYCRM